MAGERVLVVDDNAANLKLASMVLATAGFDVRVAANADAALDSLRSFDPHVILMDLQLPGMDGLELTRRLKADPATRHIAILALTAYAMKGDEEKARAAGCDGYVTKPIDTRTLPSLVAGYAESSAPSRGGSAPPEFAPLILVVEDNPITRKLIRISLEIAGYRVREAGNGTHAIQLLDAERPDLILQDLALPDIDGLELIAKIREQEGGHDIPIIVVSGRSSRLENVLLQTGRFQDFLMKPVEPSRLVAAVAERLHQRPPLAASPAGDCHVLVVDDEPLNRKLAGFRLGLAGFRVTLADGAADAIRKARADPPDVILSDILMPEMDGFEFCLELRRVPQLAGIPIVLASASYIEDEDRRLAEQVGASSFIIRSPDYREAVDVLRRVAASGLPVPTPRIDPDLERAYLRRVRDQLTRQLELNRTMSLRTALHAATLSVVSGICDALAQPLDVPKVVANILVHCLDASGLSTGFLYVVEPDGNLGLHAESGLPPGRVDEVIRAFAASPLIRRIVDRNNPEALDPKDPEAKPFVALLEQANVLVVPLLALGDRRGALILASDEHDLADPSWLSFSRALSAQLGQALVLGETVSRLAASEGRYRRLIERAAEGIFEATVDGRFVTANPACARILGYGSPKELMASVTDIAGQLYVDPARRAEMLRSLQENGSVASLELQVQRKDGTHAWVLMSGQAARDADGRLVGIEGLVVDISDRREAEEARRRSEERLRQIVGSSPVVTYALGPDGAGFSPTWVSPNVHDMTGFDMADTLAPGWWARQVHPDDRDRVTSASSAILASEHQLLEYRIRHRNGSTLWIRDEMRLVRDAAAAVTEIVGSWSDVTGQHRAEEALTALRRQHDRILESLVEGVHVLVPDGRIVFENPAAARLLGWEPRELFGRKGHETVHARRPDGSTYPEAECPIQRTIRDGEIRRVTDEVFWRKDGTSIPVDYVVSPLRTDSEGAEGVVVAFWDVSKTRSLAAQLLQAQKMEAVGQLAGGIAHDFNNLLTAILGYSSLALDKIDPNAPMVADLREIEKAGQRATALTNQLLVFSRKQVLNPKVTDLNALVSGLVRMLRRLIGENIEITTTLARNLPGVRVDAGQMEQVIVNLAVNARDAMPRGGRLTIETSVTSVAGFDAEGPGAGQADVPPGRYVRVAVSDTGCGIDAETLDHIFEPFFTTKEIGKGTGLGLAMVHGIVTQSGGRLRVASAVGAGTSFRIFLPCAEPSPEIRATQPSMRAVRSSDRETVLIVEDEDVVRRLAATVLRAAGYDVLEAGNGREALEILGRNLRIRLLLTDFIMPGMSGRDLATQALQNAPGLKVVYMSGFTDIESPGSEAPTDWKFLQKPFTVSALVAFVRETLDSA